MEDNINRENIVQEIKCINDNNFSNIEHVNNIELLLVSNNNSRTKDQDVSEIFNELKDKVEEITTATNEILQSLGVDDEL
ncbi:hypothetical protein PV797_03480 [Clostridiaceae bacterium M8S5]|nr:hypothetical protein PV797_03480 [Clostridiaceae bacterium M8S5]